MKVVLFDRDGTLIVDPPDLRVNTMSEIVLFPDTLKSLKDLAENGFSIVMITNQAGIAEGIINAQDFENINNEVIKQLESSGVKILKTYMCPHGLEDGCECRKPKPKLLLDALCEFNLIPEDIFMVGDRTTDVLAGKSAGCKTILVKTANEPQSEEHADYVVDNLFESVKLILKEC